MENQETNGQLFDVSYDENVKQAIKSAADTGRAAAITALISTTLLVISFLIVMTRYYGSGSGAALVALLIRVVIAGFLFYYLNRFATLVRTGIDGNDPGTIGEGISSLGSYFKLAGVLLIILISVIFLRLLFLGVS